MSNHDDTLLDEDLGDDVYDLRDDEEEALLADDYEYDRQNSYKGEEETDDVLDLGVTDGLDDLEADEENVGKSGENSRNQCESELAGHADLRHKLQQQRSARSIDGAQEDDEPEEERERRGRFQSERTIITGKIHTEIPDSLESVVTNEQPRMPFSGRGRGRGRGMRAANRARFQHQAPARFNVARGPPPDQQISYGPPMMEHNANFPSNQMYPPNERLGMGNPPPPNYPMQPPPQNGAVQLGGPPHHYMDSQPPPMMNQYRPPPRPPQMSPRMPFGPRGPGPYAPQNQGPPFMAPQMHQEPCQMMPEQNMPMHMNHGPMMGPPMMRPQGPPGPMFPVDNRPPPPPHPQFVERRFPPEHYERVPFSEAPPAAFPPQNMAPPTAQPNPLPPAGGHKILINPHFRGNPPTEGARPPWDGSQPPILQQLHKDHFAQQQNYQNYNQQPSTSNRGPPPHGYPPQRSDDPYSYFSDVWQENKNQRPPPQNIVKPYDSEYPRDNNSYNDYDNKYRSDNQWNHKDNYQEEQKYREREPARPRNEQQRGPRPNYARFANKPADRENRPLPKRAGENIDKMPPNNVSPKRPKVQAAKPVNDVKKEQVEEKEDDNEDPEMREYRKKMEEQKRLREKILREKENRRKIAAMEKAGANVNVNSEKSQPQSVAAKENIMTKVRGRAVGAPSAEASEKSVTNRVVRTVKTIVETPGNSGAEVKEVRRVFVQNAQRGAKVVRKVAQAGVPAQRIVVQKVAGQVKTNVVAVENLSATTTEAQIRRMCQDIGNIESIQMGEGSATIRFKTPTAALVFHKKYQRKMLDLSMITVRLVPQSSDAKNSIESMKHSHTQ